MTARTKFPKAKHSGTSMTAYELEREERIRQNKAIMASMGIMEQKTLFEAAFRVVKKASFHQEKSKVAKAEKVKREPSRSCSRLNGSQPEFKGLADDYNESCDGRIELPKVADKEEALEKLIKERRCDSQSRGSLYDSKAGITCHFCRQKKLCGETDCERCSIRNPELPCIGKSECSRCGSANGRFCRACLLIRYGWKLEKVREQMVQGTFICPHCYEEDHPDEGWICNSSICMTRRGLKPTGIAIFDAQQQGFLSVAHHVQAKFLQHKKSRAQAAAQKAEQSSDKLPSPCVVAAKETSQGTAEAQTEISQQSRPALPAAASVETVENGLAALRRVTRSQASRS